MTKMQRQHLRHVKRQRTATTDAEAREAEATTTARVRTTAAATTADDDEETTTRRTARTTTARTTATTRAAAATTATATEDTDTDTVAAVTTTRTTASPTSAPVTRTTAPTTATTPRTTSALSLSPASSVSSVSSASNAADQAKHTSGSGGSSNTGVIVGVVIGVLGAIVLAGLGVWFLKKRSRKQADGFGFEGREKQEDEQSFIGAGGLAGAHGEKYNMSDISHSQPSSGPNSGGSWAPPPPGPGYGLTAAGIGAGAAAGLAAGNRFSRESQPGLPPPVPIPVNAYNSPPQSYDSGFAPPQAAMMHHPADRHSVTNPYNAAPAIQNHAIPTISEPQPESPFEDPQWANKLFRVTRSFQPSMPDELIIKPGDRVRMLMAYDDGWCLGENLDAAGTPNRGVFPRDCVEEVGLAHQTISSVPSVPSMPVIAETPPAESGSAQSNQLPPGARSESPNKGANLQRAPTLPPIDVSDRDSQRFSGVYAKAVGEPSRPDSVARPDSLASAPTKPQHLSSSSSLREEEDHSVIDEFPAIPTTTPGRGTPLNAASSTPVKRTSSLIAGRDSELFAALAEHLEENKNSPELR